MQFNYCFFVQFHESLSQRNIEKTRPTLPIYYNFTIIITTYLEKKSTEILSRQPRLDPFVLQREHFSFVTGQEASIVFLLHLFLFPQKKYTHTHPHIHKRKPSYFTLNLLTIMTTILFFCFQRNQFVTFYCYD